MQHNFDEGLIFLGGPIGISHLALRTHAAAVAEHRLRGKEVHALMTYRGRHCERPGQRNMYKRDDHAAGVRDTALQSVHANVRAEERDVVSHIHYHPYVGVNWIERWCRRHMDIDAYYHRDMTVRKQHATAILLSNNECQVTFFLKNLRICQIEQKNCLKIFFHP